MNNNKRNIIINVGPQDPESWLFIAFAICVCALAYVLHGTTSANDVEMKRIEAQAKK